MSDRKNETKVEKTQNETGSENPKTEDNKSLNRRSFIGRAAVGGAAAAGFFALPSVFTKGGTAAAQINSSCPDALCEIVPYGTGSGNSGTVRRDLAFQKRKDAAFDQVKAMVVPKHPCNCDEDTYKNLYYIGSFTKGLQRRAVHWGESDAGEVDPNVYKALLQAFETGTPAAFENPAIKLGFIPDCGTRISDAESRLSSEALTSNPPEQRRLENPQAGLNFDTEGKDYYQFVNRDPYVSDPANPVAFPPAFEIASKEEATEIVENYWQALTRDVPFINYDSDSLVKRAAIELTGLSGTYRGPVNSNGEVTTQLYSRGVTPGDRKGPFLSQFFLRPIPYGRQTIDPRIKSPMIINDTVNGNDFMTEFYEWRMIQTGQTPTRMTQFAPGRSFIKNGRDLAEYVRVDAIYQAYLNAALLMLTKQADGGLEAPLSQHNPYNRNSSILNGYCKQNNFVEFGTSQLLTLLGEVSVRAHKAVWYQKWQVHRRLRPEAFGALVHFKLNGQRPNYPVNNHGIFTSSDAVATTLGKFGSRFLPQAFPEGSPMHPAYGAGHATLAGACVTLLKAWFDSEQSFLKRDRSGAPTNPIFAPLADGSGVKDVTAQYFPNSSFNPDPSFADELNKLAGNVSIGRNIAGVHWRSDYTESIFLGEKVAIALLEEYGYTYNETFDGFSFVDFNGGLRTGIGKNH